MTDIMTICLELFFYVAQQLIVFIILFIYYLMYVAHFAIYVINEYCTILYNYCKNSAAIFNNKKINASGHMCKVLLENVSKWYCLQNQQLTDRLIDSHVTVLYYHAVHGWIIENWAQHTIRSNAYMVHFVEITRKTAVKCFELTRAL